MKKIAIIAPCILPVPASKGGAVEELITCIINQNEISKQYAIDLYTIADCSYYLKKYSFTNIIPISLDRFTSTLDRICDKYYRTIKNKSAKRFFDKQIISEFINRISQMDDSYHAVIIENQMSLAIELLNETGFSRDCPVFFHMHNDIDIYRSPESIKALVQNGGQFIAVSYYIKSQILKYAVEAVVHVLHNGIAFDNYPMTTRIYDDHIRFLYTGRIIDIKGVKQLVEAFINMRAQLTEEQKSKVSLTIIGFSDRPTAFEKQIINMVQGHSDCIICQNRLSTIEMAERYNDYDVVLMPTLQEESFGLVALETIAKGIPLITTNSGGVPEVVGEGAIIINKEHDLVTNLEIAMKKLVDNSDYRIQLGKKAFSEARRVVEFDINTYYDRLVNILDTEYSQNKISVIVPVYNVQEQLERCIDSLVNQSYKDIEIILVDDGSTDNSGSICDKWAEMDSRIKVIHQSNRGLSGARNTGIDASTGSYIFFLDSDDYLDCFTFEKMIVQMERCNADVVACGITKVFDTQKDSPFTSEIPGMWSGKEAVMQMMNTNNLCTTAWNKLYKADLWEDIRFPEGRVHEDEATTYKLLYKAGLVVYMPEHFYKYYQRDNSIMTANLEVRYKDFVTALRERIQYFNEKNENNLADYSILVLLEYIKYVYRNVDSGIKSSLKIQYDQLIKEYGIPNTLNIKKKLSLLLWKYVKA